MKNICLVFVLCMLVATAASAQQSASPQGGTAIYNGGAACVGSSFTGATSGTNTGLLPPPCTDGLALLSYRSLHQYTGLGKDQWESQF